MSPALITLIIGALASAGLFIAGLNIGEKLDKMDQAGKDAIARDHIIIQQQVIIKKVPIIVTKVVTQTVTVQKEVESATKAADTLDDNCTMPPRYMELLVAAANGADLNAPGSTNDYAGVYGCRESLKATIKDLGSGWTNSARLGGLQEWVKLVASSKGDSK